MSRVFTRLLASIRWQRLPGMTVCMAMAGLLAFSPALFAHNPARCALDDQQREVCLHNAAQRIATLTPSATELTYAAGAGEHVVAVVSHSDYPAEARQVTSVGHRTRLDLMALVALAPDLVVARVAINSNEQLAMLEALGVPIFYVEPQSIEGIASAVERLAKLAGTAPQGQRAADDFRRGMATLAERYRARRSVRTFYEVWDQPLMSVNDDHLVGQVLQLCGGENVFGRLPRQVQQLDEGAVLVANPEAIVVGGVGLEHRYWLAHWQFYADLKAVSQDNLFFVPPELIQRPTPRLLEGARQLCERLDVARARRAH